MQSAEQDNGTIDVTTHAGVVRGRVRNGSAAFLGIPFAEPPIGEARFQAPRPHAAWTGVLDATEFGATPQRVALAEVTLIPEPSVPGDSTLNVNVFAPDPISEGRERLPVLVWIHGGGFVAGSPASPWYDGAAFNRDGVVTVSVSYRLGFDGFGWIEDAPNNRGVLDWILALEWVRDNIAAFGGDPARVTIAGQSAGGGAVLSLLTAPAAASLFHSAISVSGATADLTLEAAELAGRAFAERAGVAPTMAGFSSLSEEQVLALQAETSTLDLDSENPLAGLAALSSGVMQWGPVVDGDLLPELAASAIEHGVGADKPLILGTTDNEFNMALAAHDEALSGFDPVAILGQFGLDPDTARSYVEAHPGASVAQIAGQYVTDRVFRVPALRIARSRAETGAPTWLYRFAWRSPVIGGACHCLDVPFFFDCLQAGRVDAIAGAEPPQALADEVHGAAVAFIRTGDPGWAPFDSSREATRVYDDPSSVADDAFAELRMLAPLAAGAVGQR